MFGTTAIAELWVGEFPIVVTVWDSVECPLCGEATNVASLKPGEIWEIRCENCQQDFGVLPGDRLNVEE